MIYIIFLNSGHFQLYRRFLLYINKSCDLHYIFEQWSLPIISAYKTKQYISNTFQNLLIIVFRESAPPPLPAGPCFSMA